MTGTNDKLRGLFLAALMVLSVFAGTVAFAGTAAAATNVSIVDNGSAGGDTGVTYTSSAIIEAGGDLKKVTVDLDEADVSGVSSGQITIKEDSTDVTPGTITIDSQTNGVLQFTLGTAVTIDANDNISISVAGVDNPADGGTYSASTTLTNTGDSTIDSWSDTYTLDANTATQRDDDADELLNSGSRYWQGQDVFFKSASDAGETYSLYKVLNPGTTDSTTDFRRQISLDGDGEAIIDTSGLEGTYVLADSDGHYISFTSGTFDADKGSDYAAADWSVAVQSFSTSFADASVNLDESVDLEIDSNRAVYKVNISSSKLDSEELYSAIGVSASAKTEYADDNLVQVQVSNSDATIPVTFTDIDTGNYTLDMEVVDTGVSDSASIKVNDVAEADVSFTQTFYEEDRGDIARITMNFDNTDEGYLNLGGAGDNYNASFHVEDSDDDGTVTVEVNTYLLGTGSDGNPPSGLVDTTDSGDDVSPVNSLYESVNGPVDAADYSLNVTTGSAFGDETAVATLSLGEVTSGSTTTHTMPGAAYGGVNDLEDFNEDVVAENKLSADSSIAKGDIVVIKVEQGGMFGALEDASNFANLADAPAQEDGFTFWINQTNPGPNQEAKVLALSQMNTADYTVVEDDANNTAYLMFKVNNLKFVREDTYDSDLSDNTILGVSDGNRFEANFTIDDDSGLVDDDVSTHSNFRVVNREFSFDTQLRNNEQVVVAPASTNAKVTGTTSVAAGTEITVRLKSTSANLLKDSEVTVTKNGTFSGTFDLSEYEPGANFTAMIVGFSDADTSGVIVEPTTTTTTAQPTTTTAQPTTTTAEPTTTTAEPTTTTATPTEATTTTTGGGPGFGVAVSLVALLGAALIALRRRD